MDLWGVRAEKYQALLHGDMGDTKWETLTPQAPYYLFTPQDLDLKGEYDNGWKVTEIFGTGNPNLDAGKRYSLGVRE
ncbi:MAG: hypothetical protein K8L97_23790 [Anaerolineae bacterium]|nr:hypothetical protein [Anaerolineae bacterium]